MAVLAVVGGYWAARVRDAAGDARGREFASLANRARIRWHRAFVPLFIH